MCTHRRSKSFSKKSFGSLGFIPKLSKIQDHCAIFISSLRNCYAIFHLHCIANFRHSKSELWTADKADCMNVQKLLVTSIPFIWPLTFDDPYWRVTCWLEGVAKLPFLTTMPTLILKPSSKPNMTLQQTAELSFHHASNFTGGQANPATKYRSGKLQRTVIHTKTIIAKGLSRGFLAIFVFCPPCCLKLKNDENC